jgi:hypothetical protein
LQRYGRRRRKRTEEVAWPSEKKPKPLLIEKPGETSCLRGSRKFKSPDKKRVRSAQIVGRSSGEKSAVFPAGRPYLMVEEWR